MNLSGQMRLLSQRNEPLKSENHKQYTEIIDLIEENASLGHYDCHYPDIINAVRSRLLNQGFHINRIDEHNFQIKW